MKLIKKIKKYYEFCLTKFRVLKNQKTFQYANVNVKYLFYPDNSSENLVIVFSACTREGLSARYNYTKTLDGCKANRLYILDDFGPDKRGSYYLGHMPEFAEEKAVLALIDSFKGKLSPKKMIFCGSCKGGYAALNFGSRYENSLMIIGEPTYYIATEFGLAKDLLRYWMNEITETNVCVIDAYLKNVLLNNLLAKTQKIYLFYSIKDEYSQKHSKHLHDDLASRDYTLNVEVSDFEKHADLGLYFAPYLKQKVFEILSDK